MRFALLGLHPDGLAMAAALVGTGRHDLAWIAPGEQTPAEIADAIRAYSPQVRPTGDVEEILADPSIDMILVASKPVQRAVHLRRALQSERHVLCVHPIAESPDIAHEAALLQGDTKRVLLPIVPMKVHPAVQRIARLLRDPQQPLGEVRLLEMHHWAVENVLIPVDGTGDLPGFPDWDLLRVLGGEIAELSVLAQHEDFAVPEPVLVTGRFLSGLLFSLTLLPDQQRSARRVQIEGDRAVLLWEGDMVSLEFRAKEGQLVQEQWANHDVWTDLAAELEREIDRWQAAGSAYVVASAVDGAWRRPLWEDAVRALELDDAARRSLQRRRVSTLDYQEASEEVGFKGTMTLVGCAMLWLFMVLLIASRWYPRAAYVILPCVALFLVLQLFRWAIPRQP